MLAVGVAVTLAVGYYVVPAGYVVVVPSLSVADNRGTIALALGCLSVLSFLSVIVGDRSGSS